MAFEQLSGPQRKVLRVAILAAFVDSDTLDMFLVGELGKEPLNVFVGPGPLQVQAFQLINFAQADGWTEELIAALVTQKSGNILIRNLPDALRMAASTVPPSLAATGITLEKIVRAAGFDDLRPWAERLTAIGQATCRIEYPVNGKTGYGTGFLVADDLVLTNFHVVEDHISNKLKPEDVRCRFDYARDANALEQGQAVSLAPGDSWLVAQSVYDPADVSGVGVPDPSHLDFAVLRLGTAVGSQTISGDAHRGKVGVSGAIASPKATAPVFIVQHPEGQPMAMAIGVILDDATQITGRLRYDADTLPGSSGSGVFDQHLNLVALHHAGDPKAKIKGLYNEGIPLGAIVARLSSLNVTPFWQ